MPKLKPLSKEDNYFLLDKDEKKLLEDGRKKRKGGGDGGSDVGRRRRRQSRPVWRDTGLSESRIAMHAFLGTGGSEKKERIKDSRTDGDLAKRGKKRMVDETLQDNDVYDEILDIQSNDRISGRHVQSTGRSNRHKRHTASESVQTDDEKIYSLEDRRKIFGEMWTRTIREVGCRGRILHDIYERPRSIYYAFSGPTARRFIENKKGVFIAAEHGEHIHVIHDCQYTNSQCRCRIIRHISETESATSYIKRRKIEKESEISEEDRSRRLIDRILGRRTRNESEIVEENPKAVRRFNRRRFAAGLYSGRHWFNTIEYLYRNARRPIEIYCGSKYWVTGGKISDLRFSKLFGEGSISMVERFDISQPGSTLFEGLQCNSIDKGTTDGTEGGTEEERRQHDYQGEKILKPIEKFIRSILCVPLHNILYTGFWTHSQFRYLPHNHPLIITILHNISQEITDMSITEIFEYTRKIDNEKLIYAANWNEVNKTYFTIEESVNVIEKFLMYQGNIQKFLKNLYDIIEKKRPKQNCLYIVSPPNAGKNFFFDMVLHALINFGQIGNFNKFVSFPLQEAVNKRILLWNEPNFEPGAQETLKMLFGGDTCNVKVKYKNDACIRRTPIIVLSNNDCLPKGEAFTSRILKYTWKAAPQLKILKKKPHPMAFFYVLLKYRIMPITNITLEDWEEHIIL